MSASVYDPCWRCQCSCR